MGIFRFLSVVVISLSILTGFAATANTYSVKSYKVCETPGTSLFPCPQPLIWHRVDLGALVSLTFDAQDPEQMLSLTDKYGKTWAVRMAKCHDSFSKYSGCEEQNDLTDPALLTLNYKEWVGDDNRYFSIKIINGNEVRLFLPPGQLKLFILDVATEEKTKRAR